MDLQSPTTVYSSNMQSAYLYHSPAAPELLTARAHPSGHNISHRVWAHFVSIANLHETIMPSVEVNGARRHPGAQRLICESHAYQAIITRL